jgi:hypothetical protein
VQFSYTLLLLFLQSVAGAALALAFHSAIRVFNPEYGSLVVDGVSTRKSELTVHLATRPGFTACAIAYLAAMFFSNEALKYVSYPFQCECLASWCTVFPPRWACAARQRALGDVSKCGVGLRREGSYVARVSERGSCTCHAGV